MIFFDLLQICAAHSLQNSHSRIRFLRSFQFDIERSVFSSILFCSKRKHTPARAVLHDLFFTGKISLGIGGQ
jgi:hypothetical protein